ncbi:MAG: GGDEF domain-containing protein [Eubacteriaceae bacterium]|nr:GGDEF domain-containing protein [Eubacteriaceae bacterium]
MIKLDYEDRLNVSEWSKLLYRQVIYWIVLVLVGELIQYANKSSQPVPTTEFSLLSSIVFIPTATQVGIFLVSVLATNYFIKRDNPFMQSLSLCTGICFLCFAITCFFHEDNYSMYAVYSFPLLGALFFVDKKPLLYSFCLSFCLYLVFAFAIEPKPGETVQLASQTVPVIYLVCCFIVANGLLRSQSTLLQNIVTQDEQLKRDSFTKLFNHTAFYEHMEELILSNMQDKVPFSLVLCDLDNLKIINDSFGHEVGDKVILAFAETLQTYVKEDGYAFRNGGDEFAILIKKDAQETSKLCLEIKQIFEKKAATLHNEGKFTFSAGLCEYSHKYFYGSKEFFKACDAALYSAKKTRNTIKVWRRTVVKEA